MTEAEFPELMQATEAPVAWAYDRWDELLAALQDDSNRIRAIAAQVLCNLAKSDPEGRMVHALPKLLNVTRDERFVTARHCLQNLWKVGAAGPAQRAALLAGLETRFHECTVEKNRTLIRYDIVVGLRKLYDATGDEACREKALAWIATEADLKYRKKYAGEWRV